ncbi:MAG: DNA gyrase inhibitor YacG [Phyllobacteriaceae bacterium]|nr:DNA gyrase inhibitor YacG [Phyllobacteriaceae bacterium]
MASKTAPDAPTRPCPICGRPASREHRPFCSPRCRQIDLHRWLTGAYAVPVVEEDGGEREE